MKTPQEIREIIINILKNKNISVNKMLQDCDLNKGVLDGMKKGSMPSADKFILIAHYLDVSVEFLIGFDANPENNIQFNSEIDKLFSSLSENEKNQILSIVRLLVNKQDK